MSLANNQAVIGAILALLLTILGFLWRFNNNVIRSTVALVSVVETVAVHEKKIETHGNKISELIGANNARKASSNQLGPLTY